MNVFFIIIDSLRQDHLGCYGNEWIRTPNIDAFALDSVVFENMYPGGLFTIPVRTEFYTGNYTLHNRPWSALNNYDVTLAEILDEHDYVNGFITDVYHYFKPNGNLHRGFHSWEFIRGQEADTYRSAPHGKNLDEYMKYAMKGDMIHRMIDQYLRNTSKFEKESEYFGAQVFGRASEWINENAGAHKRIFMTVDCFDPHEPWDPPQPYDTMYTDPNYRGPKLIHPKYGPVDWMTEAELEYVRGLYAGEVTFVDRWFGRFIDQLKELNLLNASLVIVVSDHGHPHGDHGTIMKSAPNLYSELVKVPFMVRFPDKKYAGKRLDAIAQFVDIAPTILDFLGFTDSLEVMQGKSLLSLIRSEVESIREVARIGVFNYSDRCIRDKG
jgi:arylsulfatase A-like enzyme